MELHMGKMTSGDKHMLIAEPPVDEREQILYVSTVLLVGP